MVVAALALLVLHVAPWPRTAKGSFVAAPARLQTITAPSDGMVAEVLVAEGARVEAGAPLARLVDFGRAREVALATRVLDSVTAVEVRARSRGLAAAGAVLVAEREAESSRLAALLDGAAATTVRASAAGVVLTARPSELLGRHVAAGRPLLGIGDPDSVELRIAFAGDGATSLRAGQTARVITDADAAHPLRATITSVGRSAGPGAVEARVRLGAGGAWRVGVRGEARVEVGRSTVFGALVRAVRTRVRGDILL